MYRKLTDEHRLVLYIIADYNERKEQVVIRDIAKELAMRVSHVNDLINDLVDNALIKVIPVYDEQRNYRGNDYRILGKRGEV